MYSTRTPPNARNARRRASEVAIGNQVHTIHRATEAPLAGANEIEARLKGQTFERSADQRSRRQPACRADWVAVHRRLSAAGVLAQCHQAGIKAMVWTVDEDAEMRRWLTDRRVSVLITNRPADAVALRASLPSVTPVASREP